MIHYQKIHITGQKLKFDQFNMLLSRILFILYSIYSICGTQNGLRGSRHKTKKDQRQILDSTFFLIICYQKIEIFEKTSTFFNFYLINSESMLYKSCRCRCPCPKKIPGFPTIGRNTRIFWGHGHLHLWTLFRFMWKYTNETGKKRVLAPILS